MARITFFLYLLVCAHTVTTLAVQPAGAARLSPSQLAYAGAFRLPADSGTSSWSWGGHGLTVRPDGDPEGPADGWPGSLFGLGHDPESQVSEVDIPVPILSTGRNPVELNLATTLQPFANIMLGYTMEELPRADIEYLPAQSGQSEPKLHFCVGYHMQREDAREASHGWASTNLSSPNTAGYWYVGSMADPYVNFRVNDYLFAIPETWAAAHAPGKLLATGRYRDGGWGGEGPNLYAIGPWNQGSPPADGVTLDSIRLLGYDFSGGEHSMTNYCDADEWSGGSWIVHDGRQAVVFAGTKGLGQCWYGFSDGTDWYEDCHEDIANCMEHYDDQRGYWAEESRGWLLFYDPADLARVASGEWEEWRPQPYASLDLTPWLYVVGARNEMSRLGASAFDATNGRFYLIEPLANEDLPIVHVFTLRDLAPLQALPLLLEE